MSKSKFSFLTLIAALGAVSVATVGVVGVVNNESLIRGAGTTVTSCGDIVFGTTRYSGNAVLSTASFSQANDNAKVSSVSVSSCYCTADSGTNAARLGTGSKDGSLTFTFANSIVITALQVQGFDFSSTKTSYVTLTTSGHSGTAWSFNTASTSLTTFESGSIFANDVSSTSLTISSDIASDAANKAQFCLYKIRLTLKSSVTPASSVSTQSSSSSSNSSVTKTLSSISASGMTKTSYTAGDSLDTTGLIVTASYSDGSNAAVTNYTTDPANGATLSTSNTAMTVSYAEGGITKTDSVALTVAASSKTLMVRFKEILSSKYCDSIFIKYGNWDCLIDGGSENDGATVETALSSYCTDHVLDMYIASHPHDDHIGFFKAADDVLSAGGITAVTTWVDDGGTTSSGSYTSYSTQRNAWKAKGTTYIPAVAFFTSATGYTSALGNNVFTVDNQVSLTFFNTNCYPTPETSVSDPNKASVACVLSAWNQRYIFSGDGDSSTQAGIIANYSNSSSKPSLWNSTNDVYLKANHHCSDTNGSNSQDWIDWVAPNHVLISAAILSSNSSSSGVTTEQHPFVAAVQRYEKATYDIHWNGINGTFSYTSTGGATPTFAGTAKTVPYYYNGSVVTGEETTTFPMSKWCLSSTYSGCAKTSATGHDAKRFAAHVGVLANEDFDYSSLNRFTSNKEMVNAKGELYDELTDSYC